MSISCTNEPRRPGPIWRASPQISPTACAASVRGIRQATSWDDGATRAFLQDPLAPGVHLCRGRFLAQPAGFIPPGAERLAGFARCQPEDLPNGYATGFWLELPLVDMPRYLAHLVER